MPKAEAVRLYKNAHANRSVLYGIPTTRAAKEMLKSGPSEVSGGAPAGDVHGTRPFLVRDPGLMRLRARYVTFYLRGWNI